MRWEFKDAFRLEGVFLRAPSQFGVTIPLKGGLKGGDRQPNKLRES